MILSHRWLQSRYSYVLLKSDMQGCRSWGGGGGQEPPPPEFRRSNQGGQIMSLTLLPASTGFKKLSTPLILIY